MEDFVSGTPILDSRLGISDTTSSDTDTNTTALDLSCRIRVRMERFAMDESAGFYFVSVFSARCNDPRFVQYKNREVM